MKTIKYIFFALGILVLSQHLSTQDSSVTTEQTASNESEKEVTEKNSSPVKDLLLNVAAAVTGFALVFSTVIMVDYYFTSEKDKLYFISNDFNRNNKKLTTFEYLKWKINLLSLKKGETVRDGFQDRLNKLSSKANQLTNSI